jgi:hypothetical protein
VAPRGILVVPDQQCLLRSKPRLSTVGLVVSMALKASSPAALVAHAASRQRMPVSNVAGARLDVMVYSRVVNVNGTSIQRHAAMQSL